MCCCCGSRFWLPFFFSSAQLWTLDYFFHRIKHAVYDTHIWCVSVNKYEINLTKRKNICIHRGVRNLIPTDSIRWNHLIWYIDIDTVCGGQWFHRPQHVRSPWINIWCGAVRCALLDFRDTKNFCNTKYWYCWDWLARLWKMADRYNKSMMKLQLLYAIIFAEIRFARWKGTACVCCFPYLNQFLPQTANSFQISLLKSHWNIGISYLDESS